MELEFVIGVNQTYYEAWGPVTSGTVREIDSCQQATWLSSRILQFLTFYIVYSLQLKVTWIKDGLWFGIGMEIWCPPWQIFGKF